MSFLKQSSTAQPLVFRMVDSTDHVTPKTGLSPTVTISKNGGALASPAGAVTEIGDGLYKVAGNATDTATLGPLRLNATGAAADPASAQFEVVAFDPQVGWLSPTTAGRTLDVTATGAAGIDWGNVESQDSTVFLNDTQVAYVDTLTLLAANAITQPAFAVGVLDVVGSKIWTQLTSAVYGLGTFGTLIKDNLNATVSSRLGPTIAGRTLDVTGTGAAGIDMGNVENQTATVNLTSMTVGSVNNLLGAGSNAVISIAAGVHAYPTASILTADSIGLLTKNTLAHLDSAMVADGAVYQFTANALEFAPISGGSSAADIAAEVELVLVANHGAGTWAGTSSGLTETQETQLALVAEEIVKVPRLGFTTRWTNVGTGRKYDDIIQEEIP